MLTIDGSQGEGGGQILRSALALSLVTGQPFTIDNIRARRKNPGLLRQHLTAVHAAAEVSHATVNGAALGSARLTFAPAAVRPGAYHFAVGTAGSATLVLQTVLPALLQASGPSTLRLEGGTHNPWAPPFDFLVKTFLPLLNRMGPTVIATLLRPGFYPAGGGEFHVAVTPAPLQPFELLDRGALQRITANAAVANLPRHIAEREARVIRDALELSADAITITELTAAHGPGNVVTIDVESANVTEVFTGFGQRGVRAEAVATQAAGQARCYLAANAPVGEYLADQLLIPLALARAGAFRTTDLSPHARTNIDVIRAFLDVAFDIDCSGTQGCVVRVG